MSEIDVIYYDAKNGYSKIILQLGDNTSPDFPGEVITLRKMLRCYSISVKNVNYQHKKGRRRYVKVILKEQSASIFSYHEPVTFYITDHANSFGVKNKKFFEGKEFTVRAIAHHLALATVRPKMTKLLQEKSDCRNEPFWPTFEPIFVDEVKGKCPNPCFPQGFPGETLAFCEHKKDFRCADQVMRKLLRYDNKINTAAPCTKLEFEGRLNTYRALDLLAMSDSVSKAPMCKFPSDFYEMIIIFSGRCRSHCKRQGFCSTYFRNGI